MASASSVPVVCQVVFNAPVKLNVLFVLTNSSCLTDSAKHVPTLTKNALSVNKIHQQVICNVPLAHRAMP